jgi:hypothetical protein
MDRRMRLVILGLRLGAVTLMISTTYLLSGLMLSLPWQVDCMIAAAAAATFAYTFERKASR